LANDVVLSREGRASRARNKISVGSVGSVLNDYSPCVPNISNVQGQGTSIDSADARDPVPLQELMDRSARSSVTGTFGVLADDETGNPRLPGFVGLGMNPIVADQGICHTHDLTAE
jgi:hypothetical protein